MRNLFLFLLLNSSFVFCQSTKDEVLNYQKNLNTEYLTEGKSPLKENELAIFKGLNFYNYNPDFVVLATLERLPNEKPFKMAISSGKTQNYIRYGILKFKINEKDFQLEVYQNLNLIANEEYKNYLFLPFIDLTSGAETYGAGRYLDITIPENDSIWLDFNKAYHPYCAYTAGYSCPITPDVNFLEIDVTAGVKF